MLTPEAWRLSWETAESEQSFIDLVKRWPDPWAWAVQHGDLILVPLSKALVQDDEQPEVPYLMAQWRQECKWAYPDDPPWVDEHSMRAWLGGYYWDEPGRLLFIVYSAKDLHPFGHMGFRTNREQWPVCELDLIQKATPPDYYLPLDERQKAQAKWEALAKGIMSKTFRAIDYLIRPEVWTVYPTPGNQKADRFYTNLGFRFVDKPGHLYEGKCLAMEWRRAEQGKQEVA